MSFYIYQLHRILIQNYFILNIVLKICTVFYFLKQYRYTSKKSWIWAVEYFLQKKKCYLGRGGYKFYASLKEDVVA